MDPAQGARGAGATEHQLRSLQPLALLVANSIFVDGYLTTGGESLEQAVGMIGDLGMELEQALAGGGSDGNFTSLYTATLDGMGAVGDGAHARHEQLRVQPTLERAALLTLLLMAPPLESRGTETG